MCVCVCCVFDGDQKGIGVSRNLFGGGGSQNVRVEGAVASAPLPVCRYTLHFKDVANIASLLRA